MRKMKVILQGRVLENSNDVASVVSNDVASVVSSDSTNPEITLTESIFSDKNDGSLMVAANSNDVAAVASSEIAISTELSEVNECSIIMVPAGNNNDSSAKNYSRDDFATSRSRETSRNLAKPRETSRNPRDISRVAKFRVSFAKS